MCKNKISNIDAVDSASLSRYVSFFGTIEPRKKTKLCQKHHKIITKAIKKNRELGLKLAGQE